MAKPTTLKFSEVTVSVGDGGTPEVFTEPCGLTTKEFTLTVNTADTNVPDCDNPDAMSWLERDAVSAARDFTGSGVLAVESFELWDDWATSGNSRNCIVTIGSWIFTGRWIVTNFSQTANLGEKVQISVTMASDGEIVRADS